MPAAGAPPARGAEGEEEEDGSPARNRRGPWLAVVCMLPDPGHILPLLKIAAQVAPAGEIRAFVPDELVSMVEATGFHATGLGPVRPDDGLRHMQAYVAASEPQRMAHAFRAYHARYVQPLRAAIGDAADRLDGLLRDASPRVVLMDQHMVPPDFRRSLQGLGARWLTHSPAPNYLRHNTWSFMNCWWPDARSALRDSLVKTRNEVRLRARWRRAAAFRGPEDARPIPDRFSPGRKLRLSSGKAALEAMLLGDRLLHAGGDRIVLPALPPLETPLDPDLARWLDARPEGGVAYVSFGTVVRPPAALLRAIVDAVHGEGREVLLQSAEPVEVAPGVRQERWVAQPRVLCHAAVGLFVSHGGAASVEEALWSGTPVVSIPKVWDHGFNAWVTEALGAGVYLRRGWKTGPAALRAGLARALGAETGARAAALSRLMQRDWEENRQAVLDLFGPRRRDA